MTFATNNRPGLMGPAHVSFLERLVTSSAVAPTPNEDSTLGYFIGCRWYRANGQEYVCRDATPANARWVLVSYASTTDPVPPPDTTDPDEPDTQPPPTTALTGGFTTSLNQILDGSGNKIRFTGVNIVGLSGPNRIFVGYTARTYKEQLSQIRELGFNAIRLPLSDEFITSTERYAFDRVGRASDMVGKTPLEHLDQIINHCDSIGLYVLLDHHSSNREGINGEWGMQKNGLWYETRSDFGRRLWTTEEWIQNWVTLATRYKGRGIIIGADLHNEPSQKVQDSPYVAGAAWGGGNPAHDWALAAERCAHAILTANPDWLIVVEGVSYDTNGAWGEDGFGGPGTNLGGYNVRPLKLTRTDANGQTVAVNNKLVLSAHPYGPELGYWHRYTAEYGFPDSLPQTWEGAVVTDAKGTRFKGFWADKYWNKQTPMICGEFGIRYTTSTADSITYETRLLKYMSGIRDPSGNTSSLVGDDKGMSWFRWEWTDNSDDTLGIVKTTDFTTVNHERYDPLVPHLFTGTIVKPGTGTGGGGSTPSPPPPPPETPPAGTVFVSQDFASAMAPFSHRGTSGSTTVVNGKLEVVQAAAYNATVGAWITNLTPGVAYDLRISLTAPSGGQVTVNAYNANSDYQTKLVTQAHTTTTEAAYVLRFIGPPGGTMDLQIVANMAGTFYVDTFSITVG
ncbi:hypothetical protein TSH7_09955 [Azospirillum sp. TSH7]|uniref:glycoside hydrolase family 5 protein n=1 Tax=unclassified Azospirillum TaxID=2630922 RepID=UPI000D620D2D|nr:MULTISPECIES: cellulase family glycosylhydrolase [unclassified Azospirillum]PWC63992.1 hypothetical protein TSH20_19050 [Azospirillum sp. TSH20]PWC64855.1 hypothetical protein TSH7_09955 [Azospirillum sp. TSH7]